MKVSRSLLSSIMPTPDGLENILRTARGVTQEAEL